MATNANNYRSSNEFTALLKAKRKTHHIPAHVAEFFSDDALEVLKHFGFEAPALLNEYSCLLEDVIIDLVKKKKAKKPTKPTQPPQGPHCYLDLNLSPEKEIGARKIRKLKKRKK
jgi:hypothetical protein